MLFRAETYKVHPIEYNQCVYVYIIQCVHSLATNPKLNNQFLFHLSLYFFSITNNVHLFQIGMYIILMSVGSYGKYLYENKCWCELELKSVSMDLLYTTHFFFVNVKCTWFYLFIFHE